MHHAATQPVYAPAPQPTGAWAQPLPQPLPAPYAHPASYQQPGHYLPSHAMPVPMPYPAHAPAMMMQPVPQQAMYAMPMQAYPQPMAMPHPALVYPQPNHPAGAHPAAWHPQPHPAAYHGAPVIAHEPPAPRPAPLRAVHSTYAADPEVEAMSAIDEVRAQLRAFAHSLDALKAARTA